VVAKTIPWSCDSAGSSDTAITGTSTRVAANIIRVRPSWLTNSETSRLLRRSTPSGDRSGTRWRSRARPAVVGEVRAGAAIEEGRDDDRPEQDGDRHGNTSLAGAPGAIACRATRRPARRRPRSPASA
jgi:hypothetical protein